MSDFTFHTLTKTGPHEWTVYFHYSDGTILAYNGKTWAESKRVLG